MCILFIIVSSVLFLIIGQQKKEFSLKKEEFTKLENNYNELLKREKDLALEIELLQNEEYIADIARQEYKLTKENEILFLTPGSNK